jgi:nucleoside-diphosphate-sugar epimerase
MPLELDNGGTASRDFIFVEDIVEGLIACALRGEPGDVYNLASGRETTIRELAEVINRLGGGRSEIKVTPARTWDRAGRRVGSTRKSREEMGFVAQTELEDGLRRTIEWTQANSALIDRAMNKHADRLRVASTAAAR